jgi:CRISPR/Cas system-associated protein Cas5 (RAMP superfamily)
VIKKQFSQIARTQNRVLKVVPIITEYNRFKKLEVRNETKKFYGMGFKNV